ncbi:prepilin peptidase [Candidatus Arthromitus sp. SFB-turkey]|uniref:prepilin peptidase n=1 Tax=Candidatus Arthromitus sp. SFB-turkey TaxID=1840217 RepID=UPI0007F5256B|nr:prepilin peptidase [Candidatus Arthromitus sp. SFB-turkey]OAT88013.1 peptidase [Candidatus Arthromitus sp. SFB-turkey]HJD00914.1 prepilin peptidase [Candidatus Dwaynia gallinarum]
MISVNIILFSILFCILLNIFIVKIISVVDYEILGLHNRNSSIIKVYRKIFKDKSILFRFFALGIVFIIFNYIILFKIFNNFSFVLIYSYLKYYYLFLILYIFAFIDYITYYVYTVLSYPLIIFSLLIFMLSFLQKRSLKANLETIVLIAFFYLMIKKFKFLGEGDFDIILIISLTLGALPTIFIFYLSIIMSGFIGLWILMKNSFKIKNNKMAFVPFVFVSTFLFIILKI